MISPNVTDASGRAGLQQTVLRTPSKFSADTIPTIATTSLDARSAEIHLDPVQSRERFSRLVMEGQAAVEDIPLDNLIASIAFRDGFAYGTDGDGQALFRRDLTRPDRIWQRISAPPPPNIRPERLGTPLESFATATRHCAIWSSGCIQIRNIQDGTEVTRLKTEPDGPRHCRKQAACTPDGCLFFVSSSDGFQLSYLDINGSCERIHPLEALNCGRVARIVASTDHVAIAYHPYQHPLLQGTVFDAKTCKRLTAFSPYSLDFDIAGDRIHYADSALQHYLKNGSSPTNNREHRLPDGRPFTLDVAQWGFVHAQSGLSPEESKNSDSAVSSQGPSPSKIAITYKRVSPPHRDPLVMEIPLPTVEHCQLVTSDRLALSCGNRLCIVTFTEKARSPRTLKVPSQMPRPLQSSAPSETEPPAGLSRIRATPSSPTIRPIIQRRLVDRRQLAIAGAVMVIAILMLAYKRLGHHLVNSH